MKEYIEHVKVGIKSEKRGILPPKVSGFIFLSRPMTLVPAMIIGFIGAIIVHVPLYSALFYGLMLAFFQASGQSLNLSNKREIEIDRLNNKAYRPTVSGVINPLEGHIFAYCMAAMGLIIGFFLNVFIFAVFMALTGILYTQEPFYLKRYFPANILLQAFGRGFLPVYTLGIISGYDTLPLAIFLGIWVGALQHTKDFGDIDGDTKFGIQTLPVMMGKRLSQVVMVMVSIIAYIAAISFSYYFLLILLPFDILAIISIEKKMPLLENSLSWGYYYASLATGTVLGLLSVVSILP